MTSQPLAAVTATMTGTEAVIGTPRASAYQAITANVAVDAQRRHRARATASPASARTVA
jgi:hypothetical protein